jgi:hypothetical protein
MARFGAIPIHAHKLTPFGRELPDGSTGPSDPTAFIDEQSGRTADASPFAVFARDALIELNFSSPTSVTPAPNTPSTEAGPISTPLGGRASEFHSTQGVSALASSSAIDPGNHDAGGYSTGIRDIHAVMDAADDTAAAPGAKSLGTIAQLADYLVTQDQGGSGHHWASHTISVNITDLTVAEQALAKSALNAYHEVSNLSFIFTTGPANITYNNNGSGQAVTNWSWNGSGNLTSATIDISSNWDGGASAGIYSYFYQTYLHETGHALGLGHQGPYNGSATYGVDNIFTNDTWQYSVMSYFSQNNFGGATYDYVITPQMADITAVQTMYGSTSTRTGNTTYGFNNNAGSIFDFAHYSGTPAFTIYDTGGSDTLDCSGYSDAQTINLNGGTWSSIGGYVNNIGIFTNSMIENAVGGSGNDTFVGNSADNTFCGRGRDDTIDGAGGTDIAIFSGLRAAYTLTDLGNGSVRVS